MLSDLHEHEAEDLEGLAALMEVDKKMRTIDNYDTQTTEAEEAAHWAEIARKQAEIDKYDAGINC
jgi:hypothetical protein